MQVSGSSNFAARKFGGCNARGWGQTGDGEEGWVCAGTGVPRSHSSVCKVGGAASQSADSGLPQPDHATSAADQVAAGATTAGGGSATMPATTSDRQVGHSLERLSQGMAHAWWYT